MRRVFEIRENLEVNVSDILTPLFDIINNNYIVWYEGIRYIVVSIKMDTRNNKIHMTAVCDAGEQEIPDCGDECCECCTIGFAPSEIGKKVFLEEKTAN